MTVNYGQNTIINFHLTTTYVCQQVPKPLRVLLFHKESRQVVIVVSRVSTERRISPMPVDADEVLEFALQSALFSDSCSGDKKARQNNPEVCHV